MIENKKAFSVIELILAAGLFSIFAISVALAVLSATSGQQKSLQAAQARQFAAEGLEATRALRAQAFDILVDTDGSGITFDTDNNKWKLDGASDEREGFVRVIKIESAQRDGDGNIVADGGSDDGDLKLVTSTVTRNGNPVAELSAYLSRREIVPVIPTP